MTTITSASLHFKSAARNVDPGAPEWKKIELARINKLKENIDRQRADRLYVDCLKGN